MLLPYGKRLGVQDVDGLVESSFDFVLLLGWIAYWLDPGV